jgi:hypothetical protein
MENKNINLNEILLLLKNLIPLIKGDEILISDMNYNTRANLLQKRFEDNIIIEKINKEDKNEILIDYFEKNPKILYSFTEFLIIDLLNIYNSSLIDNIKVLVLSILGNLFYYLNKESLSSLLENIGKIYFFFKN